MENNSNELYLTILEKDTALLFENLIKDFITYNLNTNLQASLAKCLLEKPFPCIQMLDSATNQLEDRFELNTLIKRLACQMFLESLPNNAYDHLKFINFLVNLEQPDAILKSNSDNLIDWGKQFGGDHFYMGLLANAQLDFLLYPDFPKKSIDYFTKEVILYEALKHGTHFVTLAIQKQKNFADLTTNDGCMRNALILAKVANEFNSLNQSVDEVGNLKKMLELYDSQQASDIQNVFYNDFRRLGNNIDFLRKYNTSIIEIGTLIETNGILSLIYDHKNVLLIGYDEIRSLIENNHTFESQSSVLASMKESELENLTYFFVLAGVYDVIINRIKVLENFYTFAQEKISRLKVIIRQIRNIDVLCNLIEDIFQLVFLRWEHLDSPSSGAGRHFDKKKSTSTDAEETRPEGTVDSGGRQGFVCQGAALKLIFSFLKHFITQKLHSEEYKHCSERIKLRFTRVMDCINDGLWKFSVLEKISDTEVEGFQMEPEDLLQLVQLHREYIEKTSSEDESKERINYASLTKRKAKRQRRRATFGGGEQQRIVGVGIQRKDIKGNGTTGVLTTDIVTRKSIISNMLTTPENLAIMALAMKNFNDVEYIIQTFNLQNTELNRELKFVKNQQQTKKKLETIYDSYLQQEIQIENPQATVERIKKAAAKGFEASKIISIVDNFANANTFECSDEFQSLLEKYSHSYPFLQHYQGMNIRAVIAADLVLNLNMNYDIIANVIPVIRRMCKLPKISSSLTMNSALPNEMGCLNFLDNICECMRLIKSQNHHQCQKDIIGLKDLLCNSFYSLKPKKLSIELNREKIFGIIFTKAENELQRVDDFKLLTNEFTELNTKYNYFMRFLNYIGHLSRFLQIRDKQVEFSTTSLLKFDASDIIGELIFEENMTPLEIESHVVALNLNLIHVIALNICPEICQKERKQSRHSGITNEKYQSILNYISNQNALLAYILQKIKDPSNHPLDGTAMNDEFLHRFIQFENIECLSKIYAGNCVIAGILSDNLDKERLSKLNSKIEIYSILHNCQEQFLSQHREKDKVILDLINEDSKYVYLAEDIKNINARAAVIFKNFTKVPSSSLAKDLIESTLLHLNAHEINKDLRINLERALSDINIYSEVSSVLEFESWPQAYDFGLKTPNTILQKLLSHGHFKLCYDWCCVVQLSVSFEHQTKSFFATFLDVLLELRDDFDRYIVQTLETFPTLMVCQFYDANKHKFRSVQLLNYVIEFLNKNIKNTSNLRNFRVSLKIFEQLTPNERDQYWNLLSKPLLIVEQLIMNVKFKELSRILTEIRPLLEDNQSNCLIVGGLCKYCFDKRGNIYDIHSKKSNNFTLGNESSSAFILLNFNLYQKDHIMTLECVDLLLRIYATKALDYQIRETTASSSERASQSTDMASLDSLCGAFIMPTNPPDREQWVQDNEAAYCMCCRRAMFTMLMRRHHCRRCGRVVCFACSTNRMQIPELYEDVAVRVCNDCLKQTQDQDAKSNANKSNAQLASAAEKKYKFDGQNDGDFRWKLSGNITHDKLLREEFCYEHAPSVALCLSILSFHSDNRKCVDLLLFHCGKLEKLLVPNPEVDYELIAKMMNCLALAAKVRGGPPEVETIREHSDIIMSVVQNGCESLIPAGPLNNQNLRKLADSLVQVEKWQLALEIHWKCGFPTTGVMAAHGLACLRAGSFETAKEKLAHCMTKQSSEQENSTIIKIISNEAEFVDLNKKIDIPTIKRSSRSPPLLHEILKIIESIPCSKLQPETLARASIIRNSNSSLASLVSKRREHIPLHEPAINILNTLANLKQLAKGQYSDSCTVNSPDNKRHVLRHSRVFEECLHYVLTYGSHSDIVDFYIRHKDLSTALKYFIVQGQDVELFIHHIFLRFLKKGAVSELIQAMTDIDEHLGIWKEAILGTCRFLETKNLLNCLYELQIMLKDPIRASMTCVKFYSMNCTNFSQLHANSIHLENAHRHLQSELEMSQWDRINVDQRKQQQQQQQQAKSNSILMQMDGKSLNAHINTLLRQMEVAKFLARCEEEQPLENGLLVTENILKQIRIDAQSLPTLFDSGQEKIQICILILLSGKNFEEGFGLAYRIIQNYKLPIMKVFGATAKYLARNGRLLETEKLLDCVIGNNNGTTNRDIDEILSIAINSAINNHLPEVKTALDNLAKKITNAELKISCYIFIGQLKAAYLMAIQHNRLNDIKKILHQAEATNQVHVKRLCEKKLSMMNK